VAEAQSSIGGAVTVGRHAPDSFGHVIVDSARQGFMAGSDRAMLVAVVAAGLGSLVAARFLPARSAALAPEPAAEVDPAGLEEAGPAMVTTASSAVS